MVNSYIPLRFTIFISFSIAAASSFKLNSASYSSPSSLPKATAGDLLSVLGPSYDSSSLNPAVSREIKSCLRFLVPFKPDKSIPEFGRCSLRTGLCSGKIEKRSKFEEENSLIWWPPEPILELARLAVDSGGDPGSIQRTLDPTMIPVPDVERSRKDKCELTRTPYGRHFIAEEVNSYFEFLFHLIESRGPSVGLNVSLTRYDLFHGHLFLASESGRLGILVNPCKNRDPLIGTRIVEIRKMGNKLRRSVRLYHLVNWCPLAFESEETSRV
ncbi:uncharacterized protein LOC17882710 isoform X2 [Capsella rubella]|uniref:uncharacterized protein LOC17882710 isoform X2 n=1 Tax=Capsella rubella TaxID=81985 RepID=UPI000CD4AC28|nr:uncharacterized protein LOC17882710 isoform X2 [Capsella rubella]